MRAVRPRLGIMPAMPTQPTLFDADSPSTAQGDEASPGGDAATGAPPPAPREPMVPPSSRAGARGRSFVV